MHADWVTAWTTILYTLFAGFTLWQIWRQSKYAANAQRAWLLTEVRFTPRLGDYARQGLPTTSTFVVTLKNVGQSPAHIRRMRLRSQVRATKLPERPEYFGPDVSSVVGELVGPGEKKIVALNIPEAGTLSDEDLSRVNSGNAKLYLYGVAEYTDNTGRSRVTQFGYEWRPRYGPNDPRPAGVYRLEDPAYNYTK